MKVHQVLALASLGFLATASMASTRVAVFAIVDDVVFEPSESLPERVWISGVFVVPLAVSSGLHRPPARGHLYFSLNPAATDGTRREWEALEEVEGTGRVVGFGDYWVPHTDARFGIVNSSADIQVHAERGTAAPQPYPTPLREGIVNGFDTADDRCPRFGQPSGEIIASLRETHSRSDTPKAADATAVCSEWRGLVASSALASTYVTQPRDPTWAEPVEAAMYGRIAQATGLELAELLVDCRSTICRLRFVFPTAEYQQRSGNTRVADLLNEMPGFNTSGQIVLAEDGAPSVDYYLQYVPTTHAAR